MAKKVISTSNGYNQDPIPEGSGPWKGVELMRAAGIEMIPVRKKGKTYQLSDFQGVMDGVEGVIAGIEPWNEDMFQLAKDVKIIARFGAGYDAVDLAAAKRHGVMVTNVRALGLSNSVAELTVAMILGVYRHIGQNYHGLRSGKWNPCLGRQMFGKTVGIVGFGAIGQCFARLLAGFAVKILAFDPYMNHEAAALLNARPVSLDELLAESDIVSLSAPNTKENRHLFNAEKFGKMKKGSIFINTARGAMVDEKALYDALTTGKLAGAAIDVWEREPTPPDNPLLSLNNLLYLPHLAGESVEAFDAMALQAAQQVVDALSGKTPANLLNP